jgi:hypothetical protein
LDLERSSAGGSPVLSVASAAIAEVPFPFEHQAWPPARRTKPGAAQDGNTLLMQADCRRVAATLEHWLNEALQTFVHLAPLSLTDEAANSGGRVPRPGAEQGMDPAERLWRMFLLLPPHMELYSHQAPA